MAPHAGRHLELNQREKARYHQVAPNLAYSDPEMAEIALRNIERRAKHKVTRPEIKVGDMVRIRVKPIESRGSYRVNKIAWSEKVYRVVSAESGEMGARFGLEGWPEKVVHRDLEKSAKTLLPNRGGWRCSPMRGGYREDSHLLFDCASTSLRLHLRQLPLTDELLHVGPCRRLGRAPTRPTSRSTHHEPQTSAGQALPAGSAWPALEEPQRRGSPRS